ACRDLDWGAVLGARHLHPACGRQHRGPWRGCFALSLSHLLALAFELPADSPLEEVQEVLARLRAALAAGVEAQKDELRSFMTLADRVGSHADAWNAAPILGRSGTLDPH